MIGLTGRLAHDPAMLARAAQLADHPVAQMVELAQLDRSNIEFTPCLDDNDIRSNCTAVDLANCLRAAAVLAGYQIVIPTPKVVAFYSQSTGYDGTPATDVGGVEALVLASQARAGFDTGGQTEMVGAWGTQDPADHGLIRRCITHIGTATLGVALSIADKTMDVWDTETPASAGDPTPGSWGRHELFGWDFTGTEPTDLVRLGTWGGWKYATWRWARKAVEEAHAISWRQIGAPVGIDYDKMLADNDLFAGWVLAA